MAQTTTTTVEARLSGRGPLLLSCSLSLVSIIASHAAAVAAEPPPANWVRQVAAREAATEAARAHFLYRQTATVEDFEPSGVRAGFYREVREVIFSPSGDRSEQLTGKPTRRPGRLKLTDEDFRDLREVQPMLLTSDNLFLYETRYRGEDTVDGIQCWLMEIKPKQVLTGQRLFAGELWIDQRDFSTIRSEGQAVPQIRTTKEENLFPRFATIRQRIDGDHWFPVQTKADDTLPFRTGPVRIRLSIEYQDYRRFGAESKVTFGEPK